jgi:UDP-galactopyranose mutase
MDVTKHQAIQTSDKLHAAPREKVPMPAFAIDPLA